VKPLANECIPRAIAKQVKRLVTDYLQQRDLSRHFPSLPDRIERFIALLSLWGGRMNLTGKPDDPSRLTLHVIDSLMPILFSHHPESPLHAEFGQGREALDLGSGAGFPGLVLAAASSASFTLTESRRKRASFLSLAAAEMQLKNVKIDTRRVTTGHFNAQFDVVTSRAFAAAPMFHGLAASVLKPGGLAILYANPGQALDMAEAVRQGLEPMEPLAYSIPNGSRETSRILALWRKC
jgi:16S rRNA (guanine527-N7)-methyltransferase